MRLALAALMGLVLLAPIITFPQEATDYDSERKRALELYDKGRYVQALPIFEKLAKEKPDDVTVAVHLGFCIIAYSGAIADPQARQEARVRARGILARAQELGDKSDLTKVLLDEIPADGSIPPFSQRKEVDNAMRQGEAAFAKGDLEQALSSYRVALILDPNQYEAALFVGDVYFVKKDMDRAGDWFAQAIQIDPDRETAYRYWADALMQQGKNDEARAKYIEAIIADPYMQGTWLAFSRWAKANQATLGHPQIQSPNRISSEGKTTNITIDPGSLEKKDGSAHWMAYELIRASWRGERFSKEFPQEKEYRHTLREEAEALRAVAELVQEDLKKGKIKNTDPALAALVKLHQTGLLESYILLARPDAGIVRDYAGYRKRDRDRLRRYLEEYVVHRNP